MANHNLRYGVGVGMIGVLALVVAGTGIADAANGGSLVLGHHNAATSTTTLTDNHGTPLALHGKTSDPPLTVNSSKEVKHLNAATVGGKSASALETSGSVGSYYSYSGTTLTEETLPFAGTLIVKTATVAPGNYIVNASAGFNVSTSGGTFNSDETAGTHCYIGTSTNSSEGFENVGSSDNPWGSVSLTYPLHVKTAEAVGVYCYTQASSVTIYDASIDAIKIAHQTTGTHINQPAPGGIHPIG
jgi:hypothetical protein